MAKSPGSVCDLHVKLILCTNLHPAHPVSVLMADASFRDELGGRKLRDIDKHASVFPL